MEETAGKIVLPKSFSKYHARLLEMCLEEVGITDGKSRTTRNVPILPGGGKVLTHDDLWSLESMVEIEFLASLRQELNGTETSEKVAPNVFDVFLIEVTMKNIQQGGRPIAACVPYRNKLCWWNGLSEDLWPVDTSTSPVRPVRRIANLSGSSRVLQALERARYLCSGSRSLVYAAMNREGILKVDQLITCKSLPHLSANLNEAQRKAVQAIADFDAGFFCIQGPPGCGKTTTMVEMILAAKEKSSVIVVAPSNAAVANVALKLYGTGSVPFGKMVVFGENCHDSVRFLQPKFRSKKYTRFCTEYATALEVQEGNEEPSAKQTANAQKLLHDFVEWLNLSEKIGEQWTMSNIASVCPVLQLEENGSISKAGQQKMKALLGEAEVVLCTLNSAGSFSLRSALRGVRTLMLDEGGQCTEAEFFIATTLPGIQRVVVMGDPKQLQPTVISPECANNGYGDSFLGQIYKKDASSLHLLDTQYRMDPTILSFPNAQFYGSRINSGENVLHREPEVDQPFLFEDTAHKGQEIKIGFSWQNQYEVAVINIMLRSDPDIQRLLRTKVGGEMQIIIITPYKSQMALLQQQIQLPKGSTARITINTVDAFQGQEGDIVIVSTVRTKKVGFVDNAQRLNVALTRAKRVLRVVGELGFFQQLGRGSTLWALAQYASRHGLVRKSKISRLRHCPPDWTSPRAWTITMTQRFHDCIRGLSNERDKNYCLNTLFALTTPDLATVHGGRVSETPGWKMSSLNDIAGKQLGVVWIAKQGGLKPIVEAHFAGQRHDALQFQQRNSHRIPPGAQTPKRDMSGLLQTEDLAPDGIASFVPSWRLDNCIQEAILSDAIQEMPLSILELDPPQYLVAHSAAPLMIESRSGTGKTLVLLQHAALTTRQDLHRPACFVTVSPRLKDELKKKYNELRPILFSGIPPTEFFTFCGLLDELLVVFNIREFQHRHICTLDGYYAAKRSHSRHAIDPQLVQNEIGGVIMGSLEAAIARRPLLRAEYLENKRSNILNTTTAGSQQRSFVYDEYTNYANWKLANKMYDLPDIVLRLLDFNPPQHFSSAYLDEVQDLSHAAIFLICHLAGKESHHWVCAGDPAQMISPGCSFTFDGLKQTLLSVAPGIESKLRNVHRLVVNYRTTKDILTVANAILDLANRSFPGSIEYALPEQAVKDLGLRVVTCKWVDALDTTVKFGKNQVLIYSPSDSAVVPGAARQWLNNHPFILSSLDSKGLEFDDVVVAFQVDRKYWDLSRKHDATLRMLRELYVAVTRAHRRVVILIEPRNDMMKLFFENLGCEEVPARNILQEFNHETTKEEWFRRGHEFLDSDRFEIAASCFARSDQHGWAFLATGKAKSRMGLNIEAEWSFRNAAYSFFEGQYYEQVLDMLKELLLVSETTWDHSSDDIFSASVSQRPKYLSKQVVLEFRLKCDHWHHIRKADLCDSSLSAFFHGYRRHKKFKEIIEIASESERRDIGSVLPWALTDYHVDHGDYLKALRICLSYDNFLQARECSDQLLDDRTWRTVAQNCSNLVRLCKPYAARPGFDSGTTLHLLLHLFSAPKKTAARSGPECVRLFGRDVIRDAFQTANLDLVDLLVFEDREFNLEVLTILERRYHPRLTKVVEFLVDAGYSGLARDVVRHREWSNDDYMRLTLILRVLPKWVIQELDKRHLLQSVTQMVSCSSRLSAERKQQYVANVLDCYPDFHRTSSEALGHLTLMDISTAEGPSMELRLRGMHVELAYIYVHLRLFHIAARHSVNALKRVGPGSLGQIRLLWEETLPTKADKKMPSLQRLLMNLLSTCREQVNYNMKIETLNEEGHAGGEWKPPTVACDRDDIAFSLDWLTQEGPVDMFQLHKEFGPVVTAYAQLRSDGPHEESLLVDLIRQQEALKACLEVQFHRLEGTQKNRRERKLKKAAQVNASPSALYPHNLAAPAAKNQSQPIGRKAAGGSQKRKQSKKNSKKRK